MRKSHNDANDKELPDLKSCGVPNGQHGFGGRRKACVTNVGHDHLDLHGTLANYRRAKSRVLSHLAKTSLEKEQAVFSLLVKNDRGEVVRDVAAAAERKK